MPKAATETAPAKSPVPAAFTGPVTARGARTRAKLVKAARRLFEREGYVGTSVADITKRAGVAYGSFYTYFSSKEAIFAEVAEQLTADLIEIADRQPHLPPDAPIARRIERANRGYLLGYQENARMMAVLEQAATLNANLAMIRRGRRTFYVRRATSTITRWQQQGLVDPALDATYAANALGSMVDRSAYVWMVLGEPFDLETAVAQLTRLYCNALGIEDVDDDRRPGTASAGRRSATSRRRHS